MIVVPEGRSKEVYQGLAAEALEPPAKARFVASYLLRRGVGVDLFDVSGSGLEPEEVAEKTIEAKPDLVLLPVYGFNPSSSTQTMPSAQILAEAIKNLSPQTPIIIMGTHPSAIPEYTLETEPSVDFVCSGEGPITVHELLQVIEAGATAQELRKVRSLLFREDGLVVRTESAPLIDLNQEPVSKEAWQLMHPRNYRAHDWHTFWRPLEERYGYANPYSREGCPFHCGFCNIQAPYREGELVQLKSGLLKSGQNSYRTLIPELFLEELTFLVEEFSVKYVKIPDEMFGLGSHPTQLATLIRDRFSDYLDIWCYYRVDTCNQKHLELLRSAGFRWLSLGIEAANSQVRSGQDKRFADERIYEVVKQMESSGIECAANYIFGLPGDTMESMKATFKLATELNTPFVNFYCNQALPGSQQYRQALSSGYPLPQREGGPGWIGHSQYGFVSEPYYQGKALLPAQILAFRDFAQAAYYERPEYLLKLASDPKFGEKALTVVKEKVASIKSLKRRLFGSCSFWELPVEEKSKLVPISVK